MLDVLREFLDRMKSSQAVPGVDDGKAEVRKGIVDRYGMVFLSICIKYIQEAELGEGGGSFAE